MREAGMPGSIASSGMIRHAMTLTPKIAPIKHHCAVRELVRDERNEHRKVASEVERRTVMPGFLPGLGRASCHVSDQSPKQTKNTR
jgi:hypothetical protein